LNDTRHDRPEEFRTPPPALSVFRAPETRESGNARLSLSLPESKVSMETTASVVIGRVRLGVEARPGEASFHVTDEGVALLLRDLGAGVRASEIRDRVRMLASVEAGFLPEDHDDEARGRSLRFTRDQAIAVVAYSGGAPAFLAIREIQRAFELAPVALHGYFREEYLPRITAVFGGDTIKLPVPEAARPTEAPAGETASAPRALETVKLPVPEAARPAEAHRAPELKVEPPEPSPEADVPRESQEEPEETEEPEDDAVDPPEAAVPRIISGPVGGSREPAKEPWLDGLPPERQAFKRAERAKMVSAMEQAEWNMTRACEILEVPRRTFYRRLKEYGLATPRPSRIEGSGDSTARAEKPAKVVKAPAEKSEPAQRPRKAAKAPAKAPARKRAAG
jgi:hypothetical protein